jgi:hypothetical protein
MSGRPESQAPPEIFYNNDEAVKYAQNTRMIKIQRAMTERAVELLNLPPHSCLLLDVGCGSGLSGEVLSDMGHQWTGGESRRLRGLVFSYEWMCLPLLLCVLHSSAASRVAGRPNVFAADMPWVQRHPCPLTFATIYLTTKTRTFRLEHACAWRP